MKNVFVESISVKIQVPNSGQSVPTLFTFAEDLVSGLKWPR